MALSDCYRLQLARNAIRIVLGMSEGQQRAILRKYLLGELPESERSQLADRYFVDEKLFDDLLEVEDELLDQYVSGRLPAEQQKQFRDYLTRLPDGSTKLATAYALKEARKELRYTAPAETPAAPSSRWQIFRAALGDPRYIVQYVSIVIVIALLCGLAYLLITQRSLQRELQQLRAAAEQEKANSAQQLHNAQQNEATLKDRNLQLERELAQLQEQSNGKPNPEGTGLAVLVFPSTLRSGTQPESLAISDVTKTVVLVMPVSKDMQLANYNAVLQTTGGQLILTRTGRSRQRGTVSIRIPAARLKHDSYKLTLQLTDNVEISQDYYFNIVRN